KNCTSLRYFCVTRELLSVHRQRPRECAPILGCDCGGQMTTYAAPLRDMRFVLHEVLKASDTLTALPGFGDATADLMDAVLDECAKRCEDVLFTSNRVGDEVGCTFKDGGVTTPPGFKEAYKQYAEGGWCGLTASPEHGGQGLPETLDYLVGE